MSKWIKKLEQRLDEIGSTPEQKEWFKEGFRAGQAEWSAFYSHLPQLFQITIDEYLQSSESYTPSSGSEYPHSKADMMRFFAAVIAKETETRAQMDSFYEAGKNDKYRCPNCDISYYSGLQMAYHQFDKHAILEPGKCRGL